MREFDQSLPMLLLRAREAAMAGFRPLLAEHGLTEQQWRVFRVLFEHDNVEAAELAAGTLILRPSLTGVVDRLERDGYVTRSADETDGRKVCICMTAKAKRLYRRLAPHVEAHYAALEACFTEARWQQLHESLEALVDAGRRAAGEDAAVPAAGNF